MIGMLQRRFALSRQGAIDLIKGCIACVAQDISLMIPVGLLYFFVIDMMNGAVDGKRIVLYGAGSLLPSSCGKYPCPFSGKKIWRI